MATPAATRSQALEHVLAPLLGERAQSAELTLMGSRRTLVSYRRDRAEGERRRRCGAAPLGIEDLSVLLQLPADIPVPLASLPQPLRNKARTLPHGAATVTDGHICRRAVRPLTVDLVLIRTHHDRWEDGLVRACHFKSFACRALLLDQPALERDDLCMQAAYYGIGILEPAAEGSLAWTASPEPYRPRRHTPVAWHFTEQLNARLP